MSAVEQISGKVAAASTAALLSLLCGCSHLPTPHLAWPWHQKTAAPPQEVHELTITSEAQGPSPGASPAPFPQYWKRNTLLVDLQGAAGSGSIVLRPAPGTQWPVRLAFRVLPGQFGILEVRGEQRLALPITAAGARPVDLELAPGVYTPRTAQITVMWEAASPPAP